MTTPTTIKLPDALKDRIATARRRGREDAHAWMVDALERQADLAEAREAFIQDAEASAAEVDAGGALYAAEDVASYLFARAAGKRSVARPKALPRGSAKAAGKVAARTRSARGRA